MNEGRVTHAQERGIHVLRYFGTVNFMLAPGIQRFVDQLIEHGGVSGLVFDLTHANSLDSTNLGLMARVNERLLDVGAANSVIISSQGDIDVVLRSMGFDQTFDVLTTGAEAVELPDEPIVTESPSAAELRQTMLAAHQALVRLSDAGRLEFEPVVACLERS
jgi:anti-anti-sigma factor